MYVAAALRLPIVRPSLCATLVIEFWLLAGRTYAALTGAETWPAFTVALDALLALFVTQYHTNMAYQREAVRELEEAEDAARGLISAFDELLQPAAAAAAPAPQPQPPQPPQQAPQPQPQQPQPRVPSRLLAALRALGEEYLSVLARHRERLESAEQRHNQIGELLRVLTKRN